MSFALGSITAFLAFFGVVAALTVLAVGTAVVVVARDFSPARVARTTTSTRSTGRLAHSH